MNPLFLIGGAIVLLMATSKGGFANVFKPFIANTTAPGPGAQAARTGARPGQTAAGAGAGYQQGAGTGSPNSTLATVAQATVIANGALGFIDKLGDYFGSNSDSEVAPAIVDSPIQPQDYTAAYVSPVDYVQTDSADSSYFNGL